MSRTYKSANYSDTLRFVEELPKVSGRGNRQRRIEQDMVVDQLNKRPLEWAMVRIYKHNGDEHRVRSVAYVYASNMRKRYRSLGIETVTRKVNDAHVVYARINPINTTNK